MAGNLREQRKRESRLRLLKAASLRLREGGPASVGIAAVSKDAGLTHGAFYAHFDNKEALASAAFDHAVARQMPAWIATGAAAASFEERLAILAATYLNRRHRDDRANGCALAALASEIGDANTDLQRRYDEAIQHTLDRICEGYPERRDDAIRFLATMTGALNMARNTHERTHSDQILAAAAATYVTPG